MKAERELQNQISIPMFYLTERVEKKKTNKLILGRYPATTS